MFAAKNIVPAEITDARKKKIDGDDAWNLLGSAQEIVVGRGKKFTVFHPSTEEREAILKQTLGRTGNLRAPTLKVGDRLIVGFCDEMYSQYVG